MSDDEDVLRREVNLRIHSLSPTAGGTNDYLCECQQITCPATMISLHPAVFAGIAAIGGARLVARGHQTPGTQVVRRGRGYLAVRQTTRS